MLDAAEALSFLSVPRVWIVGYRVAMNVVVMLYAPKDCGARARALGLADR